MRHATTDNANKREEYRIIMICPTGLLNSRSWGVEPRQGDVRTSGYLPGGGGQAGRVAVVQQMPRHVPQRGQHPRRVPPTDPAAVLPDRLSAHIMQPVLDPPVRATIR